MIDQNPSKKTKREEPHTDEKNAEDGGERKIMAFFAPGNNNDAPPETRTNTDNYGAYQNYAKAFPPPPPHPHQQQQLYSGTPSSGGPDYHQQQQHYGASGQQQQQQPPRSQYSE